MLEHIIELCLPTIISACELMGIFVVAVTAAHAFWLYCAGMITRKPRNIKFQLAEGLATSLEFKMAAEILKTVLVILLRALLSLLIHIEMKGERTGAQDNKSKES